MSRITEIAKLFLRLGATGFGGPLAHMSMMEEEAVRRRQWMSPGDFGTLYATCKVLPGPVAPQMAIALGRHHAGVAGGLAAGICFVLPAFLLVLGISAAYGAMPGVRPPWFDAILTGLQAGAVAVIATSTWNLAKPMRRRPSAWWIAAVAALIVGWDPRTEPWVIAAFGFVGAVSASKAAKPKLQVVWATVLALAWVCFKAGAFIFGSGLAIVPLLEGEVVQNHQWLTHSQFMDGLAIGQITPGPVVITATFIGYQVAGLLGATVATIAIFLPGYINMLVLLPRVWRHIAGTPRAEGFSAWAIPAVVGSIGATVVRLCWINLDSVGEWAALAAALALLIMAKAPAWMVIPAAGALAMVISLT